jgi:hypothetical protein
VPAEIHEALVELDEAGYNGYRRDQERFSATKYFDPIDVLLDAGYSHKFVAGYLVALGAFGDRVGDPLERIYVPFAKRRKVRRYSNGTRMDWCDWYRHRRGDPWRTRHG